jgi:hypothetical protein
MISPIVSVMPWVCWRAVTAAATSMSLSQLALERLRCGSMRTQTASSAVEPIGRRSLNALAWCFLVLIVPGLVVGALIHEAGGEFALGGLLSAALGVSAAYSGWALTSKKWSEISAPLISHKGGRRLLIASVLIHLWWFALALLMLTAPRVTVWMDLALLPPILVGTVGLDIARHAYVLPPAEG